MILDIVGSAYPEFMKESWSAWRKVLARITPATRELWALCGRGAGKSRITGLLAAIYARRTWPRVPGEHIYVGIVAPDRKQASITLSYIHGLLPDADIESESADSIALRNGVVIEVVTAKVAAPRGRSYCLAIVEEAAFLPQDASANPDSEVLRALRPGLARVPGSLLCVITSPYARRGETFKAWQRYHESGGDATTVFVQAATRDMNPDFDQAEVDRAMREDPASARAEYMAQFRDDVEDYVSLEVLDRAVVPGRVELPYVAGTLYRAFLDAASGSGSDSYALAIGHTRFHDGKLVLDCLREIRPPFDPAEATREMITTLGEYRLGQVTGDHVSWSWIEAEMRKNRIRYSKSDRPKTELYREAVPLLNSGRIELLDIPRLKAQLLALERRVTRGTGREVIDHPTNGHDDLSNVAMGCLFGVAGSYLARPRVIGTALAGSSEYHVTGIWEGAGWKGARIEVRGGKPWNGVFPPEMNTKGQYVGRPIRYQEGVPITARQNPDEAAAFWRELYESDATLPRDQVDRYLAEIPDLIKTRD